MAARSSSLLTLLVSAALTALALNCCGVSFVGSPAGTALRGGRVARYVGVDYLLRNGAKDADPPLIDPNSASGATHEVVFKKRPFGVARYAPGKDGTGAVVMAVTAKSRYPGDPQGQAFVAGVGEGWVMKKINGEDVTTATFESIMESLDDEVLDPVSALSLNLKEQGVSTDFSIADKDKVADQAYGGVGEKTFVFGEGKKADMPITIEFQEQ